MTAVIIPNWNGEDFLAPCLDSLLRQSYQDFKIIVVDNGSTDGSKQMIRKNYPEVTLIELDKNYGFSGGVNAGIEAALADGAEFVVLFNNDAVADENWLKHLVKTADEHTEVGIVTGKFLQLTDRRLIDSTGDCYSVWGYPFPRGRDEIDKGQYDKPEMVFAGSGGASLYRSEMLRQIGLFDQDFFAYYEDQDISFRAQLKGWKVWYQPTAVAYHRMGATSSRLSKSVLGKASALDEPRTGFKPNNFARYHSIKNFYFLYLKNMPGWLFFKYLPWFLVGFGLIGANCLKRGQLAILCRALGRIMVKTPAMLRKRWQIQRSRKVSVSYIDSLLYKQMPPTQKSLLALRRRLLGH